MLDVLTPTLETLKTGGPDLGRRLRETAARAAASTIPMRATKGRAAFLGERSVGHMDPGARSSQIMIETLSSFLEEQRVSDNVSLVIVSHSPDVARGTADMVRQMVGDDVKVAHCGGNPDGGLGTDVQKILKAIDEAWSPRGVAILVDLGGAETNSEMAIELLPEERRSHVVLCNSPHRRRRDHGGDRSLRRLEPRRGARDRRRTVRRGEMNAFSDPVSGAASRESATAEVYLRHEAGLHARPAVKLTKLAKKFASKVSPCRRPSVDPGSTPRASSRSWPRRRRGTRLCISAPKVRTAASRSRALVALVEQDFPDDG